MLQSSTLATTPEGFLLISLDFFIPHDYMISSISHIYIICKRNYLTNGWDSNRYYSSTILSQRGLRNNDNEGVLHPLQISRTGASPLDSVKCPGHICFSLGPIFFLLLSLLNMTNLFNHYIHSFPYFFLWLPTPWMKTITFCSATTLTNSLIQGDDSICTTAVVDNIFHLWVTLELLENLTGHTELIKPKIIKNNGGNNDSPPYKFQYNFSNIGSNFVK